MLLKAMTLSAIVLHSIMSQSSVDCHPIELHLCFTISLRIEHSIVHPFQLSPLPYVYVQTKRYIYEVLPPVSVYCSHIMNYRAWRLFPLFLPPFFFIVLS